MKAKTPLMIALLLWSACLATAAPRPVGTGPDRVPAAQRGHPWRVAAVQMRSSPNLDANVAAITKRLEQCAGDGVRVAVFPECALTGYFKPEFMQRLDPKQVAQAEQQVAQACKRNRICAIVGTPYRDADRLYNSATVIDADGRIIERYHKIQLAESWP